MTTDPLMSTYRRLPITFQRGEGVWLWDDHGKRYLDAISGIAVCSLGHAHPAVTEAICQQARALIHTSNLYRVARQEELAELLTSVTGMDKVFFSNSGAEANEAAIKLARLHGHHKGVKNPTIIVAENSFHGRTLATLTATGNRKVQAGFEPLVQGFLRVPFNDSEALRTIAKHHSDVVAVLLEPIQGEGGVRLATASYLQEVRALCDQQGWLMMLDEIQTGMCRTGKWLAADHAGIKPDVVTLAKALGNGLPIGACLARNDAARLFQPGNHGSTFGGNPLACRVGTTVVQTMLAEQSSEKATHLGQRLMEGLRHQLGDIPCVTEVRGKGLLVGIELNRPCGELVSAALSEGLLINVTHESVIRLLPPLIINESEIEQIIAGVTRLIHAFATSITAAPVEISR